MNHDEARIRDLQSYGVLDTSPDIAFDRLTQLACDLFDAPISTISLIDADRQWFKSRQGLDADQMPREGAFCSEAIKLAPDALMVVEDARLDPRFAGHPAVTGGPGIRFYVGAVLTSPSGFNLGTLCVIDTKPRVRPSDRDLDRLRALAQIAVDAMETARVDRLRREQARLLKLAETMSGVGHWRYDVATGDLFWSDLAYKIHGLDPRTYRPDLKTVLARFYPEDGDMVANQLSVAIDTKQSRDFLARLVRLDGEVRIVQSQTGCEFDERGEVVALIGLIQDVTEQVGNLENLKASEARYRLLADSTSDIIVRTDLNGKLLYVSPACRRLGYEPEDLIGTAADRLVHPDDHGRFLANSEPLYAGDTPHSANRQHRYLAGDGRWVWLEGNPQLVRDATGRATEIVNVFRDVTERRELEERAERAARLASLAEEVAGIGYWRVDIATGQATWSRQVTALYGLDPEATPAVDHFIEAVHPNDRPALRARLKQAIEQGVGWELVVTRVILPEGRLRYLEGHGYCERDATGAVIAVLGTVVDITARVEADTARAEDEARYRAMSDRVLLATEAGQIGIWEWNIVTNALVWDERMYALYGLERGEALTVERFTSCIHQDDLAFERASVTAALEHGAPYDTEFRVVRPDGEMRSIRALATLVRAADGSPSRMIGTNWDVTAVRSLEHSLHASESRARNVIASAHQAIVTADEAGFITGWNRHAELTFGWSATEAIGASLAMILPAGHPGVAAFLGGALGEDIDQRIETTACRKDGSEISIELAVSAVRDASGWEMTALMQDISERKAQLELFENAFEHAAIGKALIGLDGAFFKANPALCAMLGYSKEQLLALEFQAITHPEDIDANLGLVNALHDGLISHYRMEKRYLRQDGTVIWVQLVVSRVDNADGSPRHYIAQIEDFTARREAEAALKDSEARYRLIAENTTDMILTADLDGKITFVATSCEVLVGYAPNEILGRSAATLASRDERARVRRVYRNLLSGAPAERVRWRVWHKTAGREVWLESNPSLLRHPLTDAPTGFLDVIREVTQQVQQEEALAAARSEAEAAATVKGEFLANMSHEIRTPLTAVIGFSGLLNQRPELDEVSRRFVQRVSSAGQALLAIVNDILDFSRLEAGQVEITPLPASPLAVAQDALALFAPQADAKGLWLECEAEGDLPDHVMIDAARVRQVLLNLLGNAVKFTDHGSIRLVVGYDAGGGRLRLRVEDTGAGMNADQQQKLFQRFSQVDASSTRKHGGTGLGLAICKGLTEAMGGSIEVSSLLGAGSTFAFDVAAPRATAQAEAEAAHEQGGGRRLDGVRVLIVDDNAVNRDLARTVLESFGAEVGEADSGRAAVEAARLEPFDCILMDLRMPGLSGMDALREIRSAQGPNQDVPILAFTADADRSAVGLQAFDGVVSKPILAMDLVSVVCASTSWDEASVDGGESRDVTSA